MFIYMHIYICTHAHTLMSMDTFSLYLINAFFFEYWHRHWCTLRTSNHKHTWHARTHINTSTRTIVYTHTYSHNHLHTRIITCAHYKIVLFAYPHQSKDKRRTLTENDEPWSLRLVTATAQKTCRNPRHPTQLKSREHESPHFLCQVMKRIY